MRETATVIALENKKNQGGSVGIMLDKEHDVKN